MFEDVTIPANILRFANTAKEWPPKAEATGREDGHRTESSGFNVIDIALEQHAVIDFALSNPSSRHDGLSSFSKDTWNNHGQATDRRRPSLPTSTGRQAQKIPRSQRWSTSGVPAASAIRRGSTSAIRNSINTAPSGHHADSTILFRSLNYTLNEADTNRERKHSSAIAPDSDYLAAYEGTLEKETTQEQSEDSLYTTKTETEEPPNPSATRRASVAIASLYRTITQGTTDLMRTSTLYEVYENAKIRGKHLQRKKWVQVTFEYTFYLILLCFVYFVLIGRPLWNGAVWWLYWVVDHKFTVAGTWSITIGLALM